MAWKDGFVIEYTHQGGRVSCYKCVYFDKGDKSCSKTGAYVPDVAYDKWRKCPYFELDSDYDTEAMRIKAASARAIAQNKKASKKPKKKSGKKAQGKQKHAANPKPHRSPNDGYGPIGSIGIGTKVTSPKYGKGKVVDFDGKWVSVVFVKGQKRMRFKIATALKNGDLSV